MDKLLENLQTVHRFLIVATVALVALGMSINLPDQTYSSALSDLDKLQGTLGTASDLMNKAYKEIYSVSELRYALDLWTTNHFGKTWDVPIENLLPRNLTAPNPEQDDSVTVGEEVSWANSAYAGWLGYINIPTIMCYVSSEQTMAALDNIFGSRKVDKITRIVIRVQSQNTQPPLEPDLQCSISIEYDETLGKVTGIKRDLLVQDGTPIVVQSADGVSLWDYDIAGLFKSEGYGDWNGSWGISVPAIQAIWPEIRAREIPNAFAYLNHKVREESERAKLKIEFLGATLDAPAALVATSGVVLSLLIALIAYMTQAHRFATAHEDALRESVFVGVVHSLLGQVLLVLTVLVFPTLATYEDLVNQLGRLSSDAVGASWVGSVGVRWGLTSAIACAGVVLVAQVLRTNAAIWRSERRKKAWNRIDAC
jgi:hypothetical protein